jgi:hypothetical protein
MTSQLRRYHSRIERVEDIVGADLNRDVLKIAIQNIDDPVASGGLSTDLIKVGGTDQSGVDIADRVQQIGDALASAFDADEQLRVDLENNNAGTLPVEQQTPMGALPVLFRLILLGMPWRGRRRP